MKNQKLAAHLEQQLANYRVGGKVLPGIPSDAELTALVAQMVDSVARINYVKTIATRDISEVPSVFRLPTDDSYAACFC